MSEEKRFTLRMDNDLFKVIQEQAQKNKRSVAKEIEHILEKHVINKGLNKNSNDDE